MKTAESVVISGKTIENGLKPLKVLPGHSALAGRENEVVFVDQHQQPFGTGPLSKVVDEIRVTP